MTDNKTDPCPPLVLLVDDDAAMRMLERASMEMAGFRVEEAADGETAISSFPSLLPDVVLLDVMLPGLNGFEVCRRIRQRPEAAFTPILMVTGLEDIASIEQAFESGATDFISKPVHWTTLGHHVRHLLRSSQTARHLRESQEALRESQERLMLATRGTGIGIWDYHVASDCLQWDARMFELFDVAKDTFQNTLGDWKRYVMPETLPKVLEDFEEALRGGKEFSTEFPIRKRDGEIRYLAGAGTIARDEHGRPVRVVGINYDITDRKKAEKALRQSEEKFRFLADKMVDIVWFSDLEFKFTYVSPSIGKVLGFTPEEWKQMALAETMTPESLHRTLEVLPKELQRNEANAADPERTITIEAAYYRKDGAIVWMENIVKALRDSSGALVGMYGVSRDISRRRRKEEQKAELESRNRLLQKAESLSRMAGAIAHHFNNQLHTVMGNLELALEDLPQDEDHTLLLTTAMEAARRSAKMSALMLTYLGQTKAEQKQMKLSEICSLSLPVIYSDMPKELIIKTSLPASEPAIRANANQIQQVLTHLVTNAWEAGGDGRTVIHLSIKTVSGTRIHSAHRFPVGWQPADVDYVCLEVADSGSGIAQTDIEKIFDPFFSSKFTGRGLGLPVVLGIVRAHGGAVTVESGPGKGSIFRVFFPVSSEGVMPMPEKAPTAPEVQNGYTVLLVEDDKMVRNMARIMLTRLNFKVMEAGDGAEAVEVFRQHKDEIHCVLCDLTMPRMNGWETLTAIRKLSPEIPVVLSSGYDKEHVMAGDHIELPQDFLGKPYRLKELEKVIRNVLANRAEGI